MAGFPRRNNEISLEDFISENQLALPSNMTDGFVTEPWMKEMLDENALNDTPLDWDIIDSYSNNLSYNANTNDSFTMPSTQEAPVMANGWSNQISGHFQTSTNMVPDSNAMSFGQSDYQSTCPSLSPETPFLDYSPSLDQFASFDTTPTLPSPSTGDASQVVFDQVAAAFRDLARARAEADPRPLSRKQKQREASIALYLQRLRDTCNEACAILGSDTPQQYPQQFDHSVNASQKFTQDASFEPLMAFFQLSAAPTHSPVNGNCTNESARPSPDAFTAPTMSTIGSPAPPSNKPRIATPVTGGVELVMDLNMNVATTMPRKHKPRTQAQRERYLAVRSQGACEKHKRQHKRCTCVDSIVDAALGKQEQNGVKRSRATRTSQPVRTTKPKTSPPRASTTTTTNTQLQQAGHHSSGVCLGGCAGQCSCFTHDTDDLRWQFLQYSTEQQQQQQPAVRSQERRNGRGLDSNLNSRVGAPPPQPCSPAERRPRVSPAENSSAILDIAAVSRTGSLRPERQQNASLQTISAQNTRPAENRTSSISASTITHNTNAASAFAAAGWHLPDISRSSNPGANPLRKTRTSALGTSSTIRTRADYGSLQLENSGGRQQVSQTQSSSSPSALRSDHGHHLDLRRDRDRHHDRSEISDRNVVSRSTPEHAQQMRQNRDPDASIYGNRNMYAPHQRSAVNSGTLPPSTIGYRDGYYQQDRNHALQSSTTSIPKCGEGCRHVEQRSTGHGTHTPRYHSGDRTEANSGAMNSTRSQFRTGATPSRHTSDTVSDARNNQKPQFPCAPLSSRPRSAVATISPTRPTSISASPSQTLAASSLRSILTTLASSTSISLSRALSNSTSGGRTITRRLRKGHGHGHGTDPLESLSTWVLIWTVCLFLSLLVDGAATGAGSTSTSRMTSTPASIAAEMFLQRLA